MINNFSNTEKSLKRYLKEKVTITTATVVSFLIAGTVAMGATADATTASSADIKKQAGTYYEVVKDSDAMGGAYVNEVVVKGEEAAETKKIDATVNATDSFPIFKENIDGFVTVNDGNITVVEGANYIVGTTSGNGEGEAVIGVYAADQKTAKNAGNMWVTAGGTGLYGQEIVSGNTAAKTTLENAGTMRVEDGIGIYTGVGTTATNAGTIVVENGMGMFASAQNKVGEAEISGTITRSITNDQNGTIITKGANAVGMGIQVAGTTTTAENKGTITVEKGTGVKLYESKTFGTELATGKTSKFTNDGTIDVKSGVGIEVSGEQKVEIVNGSTAGNTNQGVLKVANGATGVKVTGNADVKITNNGTVELNNGATLVAGKSSFDNNGVIKLLDVEGILANGQDPEALVQAMATGTKFSFDGLITDKDGVALAVGGIEIDGSVSAGELNTKIESSESGAISVGGDGLTITAGGDEIKVDTVNVVKGDLTVAEDVTISGETLNIGKTDSKEAQVKVNDSKTFTYEGTINTKTAGTVNAAIDLNGSGNLVVNGNFTGRTGEKVSAADDADYVKDIKLGGNSTVTFNGTGTTVAGNFIGTGNNNEGTIKFQGENLVFDGIIKGVANIEIDKKVVTRAIDKDGNVTGNDTIYESGAVIDGGANGTTITIKDDAVLGVVVENDGKSVIGNSSNVTFNTDTTGSKTGIINLITSNLTTTEVDVAKGTNVNVDVNIDTESEFYSYDSANGKLIYDEDNATDSRLYGMANAGYAVNDILSDDFMVREKQYDVLYSSNLFAETVKMSMDTLRMNEEAVLSLNAKPEAGKWAVAGKALYSNTDYDRDGIHGDYNVDTETTGLMGAVEYGVNDTTSVGFAFSGAKQDLDMDHGSADGDAFYFGAYGNKEVGNIRLTAGLGYQLNKIDADDDILRGSDEYDSKAYSGYVQGKYVMKAGEGFTVEPKVRLALTRLTQDSVDTARFQLDEEDVTTFDTEVGVDLVKTVALEKGKVNMLAGISYTRTMGDTDDKYEANFKDPSGKATDKFDILGANLGENTLKLNLGAEVERDNGFFYNGGVSYRFDNEDRESFGVNVGAGYKF